MRTFIFSTIIALMAAVPASAASLLVTFSASNADLRCFSPTSYSCSDNNFFKYLFPNGVSYDGGWSISAEIQDDGQGSVALTIDGNKFLGVGSTGYYSNFFPYNRASVAIDTDANMFLGGKLLGTTGCSVFGPIAESPFPKDPTEPFGSGCSITPDFRTDFRWVLGKDEIRLGDSFGATPYGVRATIPLPAAMPLFVAGLGVIGFVGRRRRKTAA